MNLHSLTEMASFFLGPAAEILTSLTNQMGVQATDILPIAIRVAAMGVFTAYARELFLYLRASLSIWLFPTAYITSDDPAFPWIMSYLAQDPKVQAQLRSFRLIASDSRETKRIESNRNGAARKDKKNQIVASNYSSFVGGDVVGQMTPVDNQSIVVTFQGHHLWIKRTKDDYAKRGQTYGLDRVDHLKVQAFFFQAEAIKDFLVLVHDHYYKRIDKEVLIFHPSPWNGSWDEPISRPARHWDSVILPSEVKDSLVADVQDFLSDEDKEWYAARGIPHRRGYLLHGRPGSGKTTLVTAIASQLKLNIRVINPAGRGMDDGKLNIIFRSCSPGDLILIEDIDCVMPKKRQDDDEDEFEPDTNTNEPDPGKYGLARSTVTLSGLLNAIDGVSSQEDCILFATTNHPDRLDHALVRPGRFDVRIAFYDATHKQAAALFRHFYPPASVRQIVKELDSDGPIEEEEIHEAAEKPTSDEDERDLLAQRFAEIVIPADGSNAALNISMAALQAYLLENKKDPRGAVEKAPLWLEKLRQDKSAMDERRKARMEAKTEESKSMMPLTPVSDHAQL